MDIVLTEEEIRVLGSLMEKEMATPEYYPLSLNALTSACNQKSNRDPVTSYDENIVADALNGLRKKKLAMESSGSRVPKYAQTFSNDLKLKTSEQAVICILLVRGSQTQGEIRGRTERLYSFAGLAEVQETIAGLERMELVKKLPKQPGRKEPRYCHLLAGESIELSGEGIPELESNERIEGRNNDRVDELNDEIELLRKELNDLRLEFEAFRAQFG